MTIHIAFTGTGYISRVHAQAARALPGAKLAAVVNHRPESMVVFAEEFGIQRTYPTVEALLNAGEVDALIVSTPNYLHAPETIAALESGVHVMVEKPMAMNAAEAQMMVAASRAGKGLLMVAHCWRFDQEVLWLREQVAMDRLGSIVRTRGYGVHVNWGPTGWFTQKELAGGGSVADMGVHAIDTARFLLGDPQPESVYARIGTYYRDIEVDDTGIILVNWDSGATSYIEAGWWQPYADGRCAATQLYGTRGFGQTLPTRLVFPGSSRFEAETVDPQFPPRDKLTSQRLYEAQLAYFLDCIRTGRSPSPGGAEGLVNMRIVDAAYESAHRGSVVAVQAQRPDESLA